jgi:hypothetical protein
MSTQPAIPIPYDELPLWMRQARQEFDWGILIALAMSITMAWSFLVRSDLPAGHQLEHYVFQASDIVTAFEEGQFYPLWSPYAINGYGAPIPSYYPMGTPYTVALVDALFTNDLHQAVRIVFILTYAVAGISVYLLVSRRTDGAIGLLASILYVYSPMIGSTIPYVLGDLPLLIASALLPLSLWSTYRLIIRNQSTDFAIHSLIIAIFIWIHPQMACVSILLSLAYGLLDNFNMRFRHRFVRVLFASLTGCLLVVFFWLPALLEHDLVNWYATESLQIYRLTVNQLITPMQQIDSGLLIPQPQFKLGWIIIGLSIIGGIVIVSRQNIAKRFYILTTIFGWFLIIVALMLIPDAIWLLVPITLCFSILGSSILHLRQYLSPQASRLLLAFSIASTLIFSLPIWLIPPPHITLSDSDAIAQIRYEQQGYGIATLPDSLSLPSTIEPTRSVNRFLVNGYEENSPQRYNKQQNNANTLVSLLETSSHQQTYRILNETPRNLNFLIPYFEGWQAFLNNKQLPTYAHPENNMITAEIPNADNDELTISLTSSPIRNLSWIISLGALFTLVVIVLFHNRHNTQPVTEIIETMPRSDVRLMLFMFVFLSIIIGVLTSENPLIQLSKPPAFTFAQSLPLQSRASAGLEATTFKVNQTGFQRGESIEITVYWKALTTLQSNYKSRALLKDMTNHLVWYTGELQFPSTIHSKRWVRNTYIEDNHRILIPNSLIVGEYQILFELYPCDNTQCHFNNPVTFFDINGNIIGKQLAIPLTITIR